MELFLGSAETRPLTINQIQRAKIAAPCGISEPFSAADATIGFGVLGVDSIIDSTMEAK